MFVTSKLIVTKWMLLSLTLFAFFSAEAFSQVVTLEEPVAFARPPGSTAWGPFDKAVAGTTDFVGSILANDIRWVRVQIERVSDDMYWDGFEWIEQPNFVTTIIQGDSWILPGVDLSMVDGYLVRLSALSNSGEFFPPASNDLNFVLTFVDDRAPIGTLRLPKSYRRFSKYTPRVVEFGNQIFTRLHNLQFAWSDHFEATGVRRMRAQVYQTSTGMYWTGFAWQSDPVWIPTVGESTSLMNGAKRSATPVNFSEPGIYIVRMNLEDFAGNISTGADNFIYELSVIEDQTAPVGRLSNPSPEFQLTSQGERVDDSGETNEQGSHRVSGSAFDLGGISDIRIQVERRSGGAARYWNGTNFQTAPAWNVASIANGVFGSVAWNIGDVDFTSSGQYVIRISATDNSGNRSTGSQNRRYFIRIE